MGFWGDTVEKEIQRTLRPLVGIMAIVPFIGGLISFFLRIGLFVPSLA